MKNDTEKRLDDLIDQMNLVVPAIDFLVSVLSTNPELTGSDPEGLGWILDRISTEIDGALSRAEGVKA